MRKIGIIKLYIATIVLLGAFFTLRPVRAAGLQIKYNDKTYDYTGTQVKYAFDGNEIASSFPGIIIDNISLAPYKPVFVNSGMGITADYDSSNKTLVLKHNNDTIKFKLGSATAEVNGKKKNLPLSARTIKFIKKNKSVVYVPARFVAETFGFTYVWDSSTGIASISTPPLKVTYNGRTVEYKNDKLTYRCGDTKLNSNNYPGLMLDDMNNALVPCKLVFANKVVGCSYSYDSKKKTIILKKYDMTLKMTLGSKTAYLNDSEITLSDAPVMIKLNTTDKNCVYVPARSVAEAFDFEYYYIKQDKVCLIKVPYAVYNGHEWEYMEIRGSVMVDGVEADIDPAYSFLDKNVALIRANTVFKSMLKCKYSYNKDTNEIKISNDTATIVMTVDSTTAVVNGNEVTMVIPPRKAKFGSDTKYYIMVPGRFTATTLGYEYEWIAAGTTSVITTPVKKKTEEPKPQEPKPEDPKPEDPKKDDTKPEQPKPEIVRPAKKPATVLFDWKNSSADGSVTTPAFDGSTKLTSKVQDPNFIQYSSITQVLQKRDENGALTEYAIYSTNGFYNVDSEETNGRITLTFSDMLLNCNTSYVFFEGVCNAADLSFSAEDNIIRSMVVFKTSSGQNEGYTLKLSEDGMVLYLKMNASFITEISGEAKNTEEVITISGSSKLNAQITSVSADQTSVIVEITGAKCLVDNSTYAATQSDASIKNVFLVNAGSNTTQLVINKKPDVDFYLMQSGRDVKFVVTDVSKVNYTLKIPYIEGTDTTAITDVDDYYTNRFIFTLPGNQLDYIEAHPIVNICNAIKGIDKRLDSQGNTQITVRMSRLQAYKIYYTKEAMLIVVDEPEYVYDKIVVLDAGHGGKDNGASEKGILEKDLNHKIIYTLMKDLFADSDIKAYWVRKDDTFFELTERAEFAENYAGDMFVSLHMDSAKTSGANGLSVYYCSANKSVNDGGMNSLAMVNIFQKDMVEGLGCIDRGVKDNVFWVCKYNSVPAVLIELGFLSNSEEFNLLTNEAYQQRAANSIFRAIEDAFEKYPTGR